MRIDKLDTSIKNKSFKIGYFFKNFLISHPESLSNYILILKECVCSNAKKTVPRRATKFHFIVRHPNVCTWDLDFQFFISFYFIN